ncbi:hypothetical protein FRX31_004983 [Thalictrum thalictroides]|uniref:Uncharacterized protein n=1 Tax=Thalictrum thalictroides TaxID=46969 RepID=A0A7J6X945_THATH|nr:hypothetical protein FRX31_004983 [Thalictrum thalictroides]
MEAHGRELDRRGTGVCYQQHSHIQVVLVSNTTGGGEVPQIVNTSKDKVIVFCFGCTRREQLR